MNKKIRILIFCSIIFLTKQVSATHMMGADMSYKCLGNGKYLITAKIYRDCRGVPFNNPSFGVYAGTNGGNGCGSTGLSIKRDSIRDVTPKCSTSSKPCSPENQTAQEGIEEHSYSTIVDFNTSPLSNFVGNSSCCEVTFYIGQCCRNGAITTGPAGQDFFTTCMINICNLAKTANKCNSSPEFSNVPVAFLCCNQPYYFNNGAIDTVDYDSFSCRLAPGINSLPNNPVTYSSPFSYRYPMTVYCVPPSTIKCAPNIKTNPPRGFFIDTFSTCDIIFTPTNCEERGVIVIEIWEWRKDSTTGQYIMIGKTRRDIQLWVKDDCDYNKVPTITGPTVNKVCEGEKLCFYIYGEDETFTPYQTIPDTVQMKWNNGIPGATFTITNPKDREKKGEFCWQTKVGDANDIAYSFTVTATDDHCLKPAFATRGFKVKVNPRAFDKRHYTILKCGRFALGAELPGNFKGIAQYKWSFRDSAGNNEFYFSSKKSDTITFKKGGRYIMVHTVNNGDNCPTIYRDTIDIPNPPTAVLATVDTFACYKTKLKLEATVLHAKYPYSYYWTRPWMHIMGDTLKEITLQSVDRDSTIVVRVSDGDGCIFYDTATVFVKPLPAKPNIPDQRICTYDSAIFDALHADSMYYLWNNGESSQKITRHVAGDYSVKVTDTIWGCMMMDTVHLFVNDTVVALAGIDKTICTNDQHNLVANHRNALLTATYKWTDLKTSANYDTKVVAVNPKNTNAAGGIAQYFDYELYVQIDEGGVKCEDKDTMRIKVNTLPAVAWTKNPLDARCHDYGDIVLNPFVLRPYPALRKKGTFMIWGTETGYGYKSGKNQNGLVDSQNVDRHIHKITSINNDSVLSNNRFVEDYLTLWFKDTNGCINTANTKQKINGNPVVLLKDRVYCQDKGSADMDSSIITPKSKLGVIVNWEVLEAPVDPSLVLEDVYGDKSKWIMHFGDVSQDYYAGDYIIVCTVTNQVTGCTEQDTTLIKIITEPKVEVMPPNLVCINWDSLDLRKYVKLNGLEPTMNAYNKFKILEYKGSRTHPLVNTKLANGYMFAPSSGAGDWLIKFSSFETGCLKEDSFTINVVDTPNANLTGNLWVCSTDPPLDLDNHVSNIQPVSASGVWTGWNVNSSTGYFTPQSKDSATLEGPYTMKYELTNSSGCKAHYIYPVTVRSMPSIVITNKPLEGCEWQPFGVQSIPKFSNNDAVFWSNYNGADGMINDAALPNIIYTNGPQDSANHYAWLKVRTEAIPHDPCPVAVDSIKIVLHQFPKISMSNPYDSCVPFAVNFNGTESTGIPAGQLTWKWDFGNGDSALVQNPTGILYSEQGRYNIKLVVTNTAGPCATTLIENNYILAYPNPVADFVTDPPFSTTVALPKFKMINRSTLDKSVFLTGYLQYRWNFDDPITDPNDTSTLENPRYAYGKDTNTYNITLTVTSNEGCISEITRSVFVGPDIIIFIPDVFTPDGAGPPRNNTFKIHIQNYKTMNMRIYNRWGEKMFETDDLAKGWDGTANGQVCQQEVYVYKIEVLSLEGKLYKFDGTITLLR